MGVYLKLYGIESLIKRFLVLETTDGDTNPLFTLTATPREHVAMVVKAINNGMGHITDWKTGTVEGTELITIDYEGMYCDEALKAIAEKAGGKVEWWVEGQTVNVCRCEHGEEITLGYGKGLTSLEKRYEQHGQILYAPVPGRLDPQHRCGEIRQPASDASRRQEVHRAGRGGIWHL